VIRYLLRRVGQAVVVLFGVSVAVFSIIHLVPGDPVRLALGTRFNQETYDALVARSGLDDPVVVQYVNWLGNALTGDLGVSFRSGRPVTELILERLPATMSLALGAILVALLIALPLGLISALRPRSVVDYVATFISQAGISIPDFWLAIVSILVFSLTLSWLPSSGYVGLTDDPVEWARHLVLPSVVVGTVSGAILTRFVRSSALEALGQDYTRTARAKGLPRRVVVNRHVLRNALVPVVTLIALQLPTVFTGAVVTEQIFRVPGIGSLLISSIQANDTPVIMAIIMVFSILVVLFTLVADLLYGVLDPRVRYG
jgi:peptide/nickel transport system permease protein